MTTICPRTLHVQIWYKYKGIYRTIKEVHILLFAIEGKKKGEAYMFVLIKIGTLIPNEQTG